MTRAKPEFFKDKAVQSPQAPEDKGLPAAKSGLYRVLGALLMKVRTGRSVTGEVGAITYKQPTFELSIIVLFLGKSVYRDTKALFSVYYDSHSHSDLSDGNKNFSLEGS
jgi:hypothetical protein